MYLKYLDFYCFILAAMESLESTTLGKYLYSKTAVRLKQAEAFFSTLPSAHMSKGCGLGPCLAVFGTSQEFHAVKLRVISGFLPSVYCVTLLARGDWGGFVAYQQPTS